MNNIIFLLATRFATISFGILTFAWYDLGYPKTALIMLLLGMFDPKMFDTKKKS
jgi:hypothetical protein